jgi:hypothetical protein
MPSDRSRRPDPPSDAYTGVAMQQGRVLLDRDFNVERDILDYRDRVIARDEIGPCGTPDMAASMARTSSSVAHGLNRRAVATLDTLPGVLKYSAPEYLIRDAYPG